MCPEEDCDNLGGFEKSGDFAALLKAGYRSGKQRTEEQEMQDGFDVGFRKGVYYGKCSGCFYANCVLDQSSTRGGNAHVTNSFQRDLKTIVYDDFDVSADMSQLRSMLTAVRGLIDRQRDKNRLLTFCNIFENEIISHFEIIDKTITP